MERWQPRQARTRRRISTGAEEGAGERRGAGEGTEEQRNILRINDEIDKELKADKRKLENTIKILLLGCGEAGKVDRR